MFTLPLRRLAFLLILTVCLPASQHALAQDATPDDPADAAAPADPSDDGDPNLDPTLIYTTAAPAAPIVEKAAASGVAGQDFSYQIKASNDPASYGAEGLPEGLSVDPASGLISGKPLYAGAYAVKLLASNAVGTGKRKLALSIYLRPIPAVTVAKDQNAVLTDKTVTNGSFVVTRTGNLNDDISVRYTVSGSALNGVDYKKIKGTVSIKATKTSRKISVVPLDRSGTGKRAVKVTLETGIGYTLGTETTAKIKVTDAK